MKIIVKQLTEENLLPSIRIWNEVVEEGRAFPQGFKNIEGKYEDIIPHYILL